MIGSLLRKIDLHQVTDEETISARSLSYTIIDNNVTNYLLSGV